MKLLFLIFSSFGLFVHINIIFREQNFDIKKNKILIYQIFPFEFYKKFY